MSDQRHGRIADLYQADLERHLFALQPRPSAAWHAGIGLVVARLRGRWTGGWTRLQTAMADATYFL